MFRAAGEDVSEDRQVSPEGFERVSSRLNSPVMM